MDWPWLVGKAEAMFLPKIDAELLAEIDGMVEGLGVAGVKTSRGEMIAYNGITELSGLLVAGGEGDDRRPLARRAEGRRAAASSPPAA